MADWLDELNLTAGAPWVAMGTRALDDGLFIADADRDRDLVLKADLLATHHAEVFAARDTPTVLAASQEIHRLVGGESDDLHPLDAAARRVQEDLCLLVLRDGAPHLDAASLCFPSYWRLADKLGRPLAEVHRPVPHYAAELAPRVDGFLRRLQPGRMVWRRNWSIHDDPHYFLPDPTPPHTDDPTQLYLRSERQVLRRLATPDAVLFTIRTQQVPLTALRHRPDIAHGLAAAIAAWSPELREYKGGHGALVAQPWLASL